MIDLQRHVLTNAAGMVKTREQAEALLKSAVTRITIGSITLLPSLGNSGTTYHYDPVRHTAWNSKGLDNPGIDAVMEWLPAFYEKCVITGKELAVSIAGVTPGQYGLLAFRVSPHCDIIEVNAGCGNLWGPGGQKPIASYHPDLLDEIIRSVGANIGNQPKVAIKISPIPEELRIGVAGVFKKHSCVAEIICCNTKPLEEGLRDDGTPALSFVEPGGTEIKHVGGMSGKELKPYSLDLLGDLALLLPRLRLIGCGGIESYDDLADYRQRGATGWAMGTAFFEQGPRIFSDILLEGALAQED